MGNRAVIKMNGVETGIYLHWNGGRDSVEGFLEYCKMKDFRGDYYGMARLTQIIANYFGGGLSIGIDTAETLDCDNYDNGMYIIDEHFNIVERKYFDDCVEQKEYPLKEMVIEVNNAQPKGEQFSMAEIDKWFNSK